MTPESFINLCLKQNFKYFGSSRNYEIAKFKIMHHAFIVNPNGLVWARGKSGEPFGYLTKKRESRFVSNNSLPYNTQIVESIPKWKDHKTLIYAIKKYRTMTPHVWECAYRNFFINYNKNKISIKELEKGLELLGPCPGFKSSYYKNDNTPNFALLKDRHKYTITTGYQTKLIPINSRDTITLWPIFNVFNSLLWEDPIYTLQDSWRIAIIEHLADLCKIYYNYSSRNTLRYKNFVYPSSSNVKETYLYLCECKKSNNLPNKWKDWDGEFLVVSKRLWENWRIHKDLVLNFISRTTLRTQGLNDTDVNSFILQKFKIDITTEEGPDVIIYSFGRNKEEALALSNYRNVLKTREQIIKGICFTFVRWEALSRNDYVKRKKESNVLQKISN